MFLVRSTVGIPLAEHINDQYEMCLRQLRAMAILPAGSVFMYGGVDTDQFRNLYANMNYAVGI